jgi:hypothetical protein
MSSSVMNATQSSSVPIIEDAYEAVAYDKRQAAGKQLNHYNNESHALLRHRACINKNHVG